VKEDWTGLLVSGVLEEAFEGKLGGKLGWDGWIGRRFHEDVVMGCE
jgi:hypothetical protein